MGNSVTLKLIFLFYLNHNFQHFASTERKSLSIGQLEILFTCNRIKSSPDVNSNSRFLTLCCLLLFSWFSNSFVSSNIRAFSTCAINFSWHVMTFRIDSTTWQLINGSIMPHTKKKEKRRKNTKWRGRKKTKKKKIEIHIRWYFIIVAVQLNRK